VFALICYDWQDINVLHLSIERRSPLTSSKHIIAVIGTGYVGLTTGACLAKLGHSVTCVDSDLEKLALISSGVMPIYEDGLSEIVGDGRSSGRLKFTSKLFEAVSDAEFIFLCLPTPADKDGFADLSAIKSVTRELRGELKPGTIIVNKSTVPVNSARMIEELIDDKNITVVSNPEFLREGSAVHDFLNPDRIVVGSVDPLAGEKVGALYLGARCPVVVTDPISAESIKYMANAFLALKISFVNQAADFCDAVGANITEVMRGLSFDPRIGSTFLKPGPGWGGSCFPKDTKALVASAAHVGKPMTLIEEAINANELHILRISQLIDESAMNAKGQISNIAILGLSFKANTDDSRESPALQIIRLLQTKYPNIKVYDPHAKLTNAEEFKRVSTLKIAVADADVVAILTEWPEFADLSPAEYAELMAGTTIVDARYVLDVERFANVGINIRSLGQ
jgi:UDPglucose 6-dehydrogenase